VEIKFEEIKALLPQRFPLLMVDRIIAFEKGKKAIAIKNVSGNDIFFLGHFPGMAVLPGALLIEAMAQTAIVLFRKSYEDDHAASWDDKNLFFFGSAKARFMRPVFPGDQVQIELIVLKSVSTGAVVEAVATVEGRKIAKAELGFGVKRVDDFQADAVRAGLTAPSTD
jgi:3-hydroxyacyl-[acyl-carrier-protein] dehydratase